VPVDTCWLYLKGLDLGIGVEELERRNWSGGIGAEELERRNWSGGIGEKSGGAGPSGAKTVRGELGIWRLEMTRPTDEGART
jgi:hypothetical protein